MKNVLISSCFHVVLLRLVSMTSYIENVNCAFPFLERRWVYSLSYEYSCMFIVRNEGTGHHITKYHIDHMYKVNPSD